MDFRKSLIQESGNILRNQRLSVLFLSGLASPLYRFLSHCDLAASGSHLLSAVTPTEEEFF